MKLIVTTTLLFLFTLVAHAELREAVYTLGPERFREGDRIQIETVKASSEKFKVGETVSVSGRYTLESHEEGIISLFVTQTEGDGLTTIAPEQQFQVREGRGNFAVSIEIQHEGYLHVSFYPIEGGNAFGGVYFGQSKQMKAIEDWTLDWYLGGAVTRGHKDRVNASN